MKKIVKEQIEKVASVHKEVNDTEPEWHFQDYINETLEAKGYAYRVSRWDF
jgi:coproporphyrinogen III oxidase-like Fe-S oxidoreductase